LSQTKIQRGKFLITAGFDRPCNNFFANIETPEDEDFPWYSTMDDPKADGMGGFPTLLQVRLSVESRVGVLPEKFWNSADIRDMNEVRVINDFEDGESRLPPEVRSN